MSLLTPSIIINEIIKQFNHHPLPTTTTHTHIHTTIFLLNFLRSSSLFWYHLLKLRLMSLQLDIRSRCPHVHPKYLIWVLHHRTITGYTPRYEFDYYPITTNYMWTIYILRKQLMQHTLSNSHHPWSGLLFHYSRNLGHLLRY